ncbi:MAG: S8 family serine peptidase [Prevotella sp.]|nr:S8 family serine peptidase [Prevotella sp.]
MKKLLMIIVLLLGTFTFTFAQNEKKLSAGTRMVIAQRDSKMATAKVAKQQFIKKNNLKAPVARRGKAQLKTQQIGTFGTAATLSADEDSDDGATFAEPFISEGVEKVQVWVKLTDNNLSTLESIAGVKVTATFDKLAIANIPLNALEQVAALKNVTKVSVATMFKKETYYGREATNVDDVLNYTADAQAAGLLQAYDGTGVVIGIIDTGIQFDHQMFKDGNGNTRIKKAIVYDATTEELVEYDTQSAIEALTYDTNSTYHGSHTSSIAGGSNFSFTGYYYDNSTSGYASGTRVYGGMAPNADLVLCGLADELSDANIASCIQKISQYADQVGKPCVISISLGSQAGPHDGTGYLTDICQQYMSGPGKVMVKAAGNDGDEQIYLYKSATKASPAQSLLDLTYYDGYTSGNYTLNNYFLFGQAFSYARTPGVELAAKFYVVDTSTNTVVWVSDEMTSDTQWSVNSNETDPDATYNADLAQYFSAAADGGGYLCAFFDTDAETGKNNIYTNVFYLKAEDYTQSGTTVTGKYKIGISYYPKNNGVTCDIDSWGLNETYFGNGSATYNGTTYTFDAGNSLCSISDDGTNPYVIPIGSYCSMKSWAASNGSGYTINNGDLSDIAPSSGYQAPGYGPLGTKLPWITAPGQMIVAAFNRGWVENNSSSVYLLYQYDSTNPIGVASGTSMASPCAGGIVALWLQADPTLTIDDVKNVMKSTAISDSYTSGTNANMFGNGKIDALNGIKYILNTDPSIYANPTQVTFNEEEAGTYTKTINITAQNLTGNITATLNDANGIYSIDQTSISATSAQTTDGVTLTITYAPTTEGTTSATITLSSAGADDVTITINGTYQEVGKASDAYLNIAKYATIDDAGWRTTLVNNLYKYTEYKNQKVAWLTLPVYGAFVGARYATNSNTVGSGHPQAWIECDLGTNNTYAGTTWNYTATYTNPYNGSSAYFTSATARAIGYNSRTNTSIRNVSFYVTNTTAVKLLGMGARGASSTYPAAIKVFECTKNTDGTITASTTAIKSATSTSTSTSTAFNINVTDLDETKIYKVEASVYRGYLYEIGFQTPLKSAEIIATPTSLSFETPVGVPVSKTFNVKGNELEGDITATLTTNQGNVYSLDPSSITVAEAQSGTGKDVTVTFSPTTAGTFTGTVTLTSSDANDVTVNLTGIAHQPVIEADPTALSFETEVGVPQSLTFDVLAEYLSDDITVTLADENGVYTVDAENISIADAENGKTVTVTFTPSEFGTFTGTVTLSSPYAQDAVVTLNGVASEYFDVTISEVGLTTLYLDYPVEIPYETYDPDILGVFYIYDIVGKELKAARLYETIPANTGVIIQGNSNTTECPVYRFPRIAEEVSLPANRTNLLSGSTTRTTVAAVMENYPGGTLYTLGRGSDSYINFYRYSGKNLAANKAFLIVGGNNAKGFTLVVDGEQATGIKALDTVADDGAWYTVEGIKLQGKPTRKGVYLHNGKSVIIK